MPWVCEWKIHANQMGASRLFNCPSVYKTPPGKREWCTLFFFKTTRLFMQKIGYTTFVSSVVYANLKERPTCWELVEPCFGPESHENQRKWMRPGPFDRKSREESVLIGPRAQKWVKWPFFQFLLNSKWLCRSPRPGVTFWRFWTSFSRNRRIFEAF